MGLPENVTLEDIMRELYVRSKIDKCIQELNAGKAISHDEVKEKLDIGRNFKDINQ
ncbi:hypothetical protein KH400_18890 [Desertibacillus haloalkaliphilus]|nr:hypothetical protein [Desertibacillus haloalkaliphilus]